MIYIDGYYIFKKFNPKFNPKFLILYTYSTPILQL